MRAHLCDGLKLLPEAGSDQVLDLLASSFAEVIVGVLDFPVLGAGVNQAHTICTGAVGTETPASEHQLCHAAGRVRSSSQACASHRRLGEGSRALTGGRANARLQLTALPGVRHSLRAPAAEQLLHGARETPSGPLICPPERQRDGWMQDTDGLHRVASPSRAQAPEWPAPQS